MAMGVFLLACLLLFHGNALLLYVAETRIWYDWHVFATSQAGDKEGDNNT